MPSFAEKGSTLILTTWILMIIAVGAGFLLYRAELEWAVTLTLEQNRQVQELAGEVLAEHLSVLTVDDNEFDSPQDGWFNNTGLFETERKGYKITVAIEDEGSKPKLNLLSEKGLTRLLDSELSPDPVLDWIDSDNEVRPEGAEAAYYQGLNPAYLPRDGFTASPRELLQLKDGAQYFENLASTVTVYGKYNPNTLNPEKFGALLLAYGFEKFRVERVINDFRQYREKYRFNTLDDLLKLPSVSIATRDKLKRILEFSGSCNLNFCSETGIKAILSEAGVSTELAAELVQHAQAQPFTNVAEIKSHFKANSRFKVEDYFTTVSTIFRYRIWLVKNGRNYYFETIQERLPGANKSKWRVQTLAWLELSGEAIPPVPAVTDDDSKGGADQSDAP
ncbi:MAG TPA: hypothetical protein VEC37_13515 [Bacillota bacterium]|nr:hypothetical protein [Bacillota bacterium]